MKVGIIGAGLIGGSLTLALAAKGYKLSVITRNRETDAKLQGMGIFSSTDLQSLVDCNFIFVCAPMNKTIDILDRLETIVTPDTIVCDVSSLKNFVMQKDRPYKFIGTHPMAGTEHSGFSAAFKELFIDAKWVLTPSANVDQEHIDKLQNLIRETGAKTVIMEPEQHDRAVALISHMPMLISQALMKCAMPEEEALILASSGFRDMTRLAMSNTEMAEDMIKMNNKNIKDALNYLVDTANTLLSNNYLEEVIRIKEFRTNMYNSNGKNKL